MKLRHKAELKALQSQPAKGIGAKKKQKDDEKLMLQRHDTELSTLEQLTTAASDNTATPADDASAQPHTATAAEHSSSAQMEVKDDEVRGKQGSRAQQKRDKRTQRDKQRQAELAAEVANMADPRADENTRLAQQLTPHHLTVQEIISDGHCLFRAVSHQLSLLHPPPLPQHSATHTALRQAASSYMEQHMSHFLPYLMHDDDGEAGGTMSSEEAADYVRALRRDSGDVVWGGHAECVALSGVVGRPLHVWSADGGEMVVTGVDGDSGETAEQQQQKGGRSAVGGSGDVQISFHKYYFGLGNHYNSVVPATVQHDDDDIDR